MAFVRKKVKTFKWPVKVEEPADGGVFETSTFADRQKELGLITSDDYKKVLLGREGERLADPKLGLTSEQQARGLDQYRQTIGHTQIFQTSPWYQW